MQKTWYVLLFINLVAAILVFYLFPLQRIGDEEAYLSLADGLLQGRYSMWYFLPDYIPDTLRNPGYPLFIAFIRFITLNVMVIRIVQLLLYLASLLLILDIARKFSNPGFVRSIFLILTFVSVFMVTFSKTILPESLMTFLIALYIWICFYKPVKSFIAAILIGLLCGYIFQVRPFFIFFPIIKFGIDWIYEKKNFSLQKQLMLLAVYGVSMLPFGFWNAAHHDRFKITSVEGAAGVYYFGYWSFKIPGYYDMRYWKWNYMSREMIPFVDSAEASENYTAFNVEWDSIENKIRPLLTRSDSIYLEKMQLPQYENLRMTFNTKYTERREEILKRLTSEHYKNDPVFFIKTRCYTALRLWFSGIQKNDWQNKSGLNLLVACYPFIASFLAFIFFLSVVPFSLVKRRIKGYSVTLLLALILYTGIMHIPFALQARYTIPVRMEMFLLTALALASLVTTPKSKN